MMARYWANNGQPGTDGRLCFIVDPEDGTQPIRTYGRTQEEVLDKMAKGFETGQQLISRQRAAAASATSPAPRSVTPAPPARSLKLTPDEQMTATADLGNPAKAPAAIVKLVEHATGINLTAAAAREQENRIAGIAQQWERSHPEFPASLTNRKLLLNTAVLNAGGIQNVNSDTIENTYQTLLAQDAFAPVYEEVVEEVPSPTSTPNPQAVPPEGTPNARTTVRPRGATTVRSSQLRATAPLPTSRTPKYTRAQIDSMSADELAEKYRSEDGFAELVASYAQPPAARRATA